MKTKYQRSFVLKDDDLGSDNCDENSYSEILIDQI